MHPATNIATSALMFNNKNLLIFTLIVLLNMLEEKTSSNSVKCVLCIHHSIDISNVEEQ